MANPCWNASGLKVDRPLSTFSRLTVRRVFQGVLSNVRLHLEGLVPLDQLVCVDNAYPADDVSQYRKPVKPI